MGAVFVFDVSYSMGMKDGEDGNETRLDRAKAAALDVIDKLPPHSTVQIITCADRATFQGPRDAAQLDHAKEIINNLELTHLRSDLYPGIKEAEAVLQTTPLTNRELYIFSDMQKPAWDRQQSSIKDTLKQIKEKSPIYLVNTARGQPKNAAIVGLNPLTKVPQPKERIGFSVLVRNTGQELIKDLTVTLRTQTKKTKDQKGDKDQAKQKGDTKSITSLKPGETKAVTLSTQFDESGMQVITAELSPDALERDNRFDQVVFVRDKVNVLLVDGNWNDEKQDTSSSYYLGHALLPVPSFKLPNYFLQVHLVTPDNASPASLKNKSLCVLTNVAVRPLDKNNPALTDKNKKVEHLSTKFLKELERFVRKGGGLMIFAGDYVEPDAYNQELAGNRHLLPFPLRALEDAATKVPDPSLKKGVKFNRASANLPAFFPLREGKYYQDLDGIDVWKRILVEEKSVDSSSKEKKEVNPKDESAATVVMRYNDGQPAIISYKVGAGEVFFFTTAAHPGLNLPEDKGEKKEKATPEATWSDWPGSLAFPPMVQITVNHLLHQQLQSHNAVAGSSLVWHPPENEKKWRFSLDLPNGTTQTLGAPSSEGDRLSLKLEDLPMAGQYKLIAKKYNEEGIEEDSKERPFAVAPDLRESATLESLSAEELDARVEVPVIHATAGTDPSSYLSLDRTNLEWTMWLLLGALLLLIRETFLAFMCSQPGTQWNPAWLVALVVEIIVALALYGWLVAMLIMSFIVPLWT